MIDAPSKGIKAPAHPYVEAIVDGVSESDRKRNREREEREEIENINTTVFPARLETHSRTTTPCAVSIPMPEVYSRITGARL